MCIYIHIYIYFFYIYTFLGGTCIIIKDVDLTLARVFVCFFLKLPQGQKLAFFYRLDRDRTEDETSTEDLKLKVQEKSEKSVKAIM